MIYFVLLAAIIFNASANILIRMGMRNADFQQFSIMQYLAFIFGNVYLLSGVASFGLALAAYSYVLSKMNLSIAYPIMTSVGFVIVVLFSVLFLNEKLIALQILGIALIMAGVWLIAYFQ